MFGLGLGQGFPGAGGKGAPGIAISNASFPAGSAQNTAIGTLSVSGGIGTYTFTLTDSHTNAVQVAGTNGVSLQAGSASSSAGSFSITVHATNGLGGALGTFDRIITIVAWSAVANSVAPAITGSAVQGATLLVSNGTWTGSPSPTFTYQWKRAGSPISGATASTYTLVNADVGAAITCTVTGSNGFSNASATSSATAAVTKTTLSYTPVTAATQGSAYTGATPSTNSGTAPYGYSISGSLPAGLSINSSTGVISGTPTTVQTVTGIVLIVTDANGVADGSASFSIAVSAASSVPTAFALTDIASGQLFQRTKALTTGPVSAAGTYSGGNPSAIELQVRKVSDNSIVKAWTTATATIGSGAWSAAITGVAQGGSYFVEARPSNATGLAASGSNPFYVGILVVMYGQSNMTFMSGVSSSPPSATAGTTYYSGSAWTSVPAGNGVRELLNGLIAATGIPCAALNGAVSGVTIDALSKGNVTGYYAALAAQITAAANDFEFIVWHQGEGDSSARTPEATYLAALSQLHSDLTTDFSRTKAQAPIIVAGLASVTGGASGFGDDASWDAMERTLIDAATTNASTTYSHSNRDANVVSSNVHWDGPSYGKAGKRYARSISTLLGSTAGLPNWRITASAVVDATHSTVDVTHGLGTDFTPTSGISGFDVSGDNGATWSACTGVRTSATRITLTHASVATNSNRKLRYQYGILPDISAPVVDNSSLSLPLDNSAGNLSPTPLAVLPTVTFASSGNTTGTGQTQTRTGVTVPGGSASLLALIGVTSQAHVKGSSGSVTCSPSTTVVALTLVDTNANNADMLAAIYQAVLPSGTTSIDISITFGTNPFAGARTHVSTIDVSTLSSTTAVGSGKGATATGQTVSCTLPTSSGGVVFAVAQDNNFAGGNTLSFSGTESYGTRNTAIAVGGACGVGDASGVATNASSTVTASWSNATTAQNSICAAAWR